MEPGYAWIRLSQFQERTVDDFVRKVKTSTSRSPNLKGLVLDLRNDPGGLLDAAVAISAPSCPRTSTVVSTNGQLRKARPSTRPSPEFYYHAPGGSDPLGAACRRPLKKVPLVVLVNEGSASASEIVAGALQDHKRATIMGSQTFGKGRCNRAPAGARHRHQDDHRPLLHPSGKSIQAKGIVPDVMIDESPRATSFRPAHARGRPGQTPEQGQGEEKRTKAREAALQALEEEAPAAERPASPEFGSAAAGAQPAQRPAGQGQQDAGQRRPCRTWISQREPFQACFRPLMFADGRPADDDQLCAIRATSCSTRWASKGSSGRWRPCAGSSAPAAGVARGAVFGIRRVWGADPGR